MKRRPVGGTLAWLLFVYILPGLGIIFYLLFGERYLGRLRAKRALKQFRYYTIWLQKILIKQEAAQLDDKPLLPIMRLMKHSLGMPILSSHHWSIFDIPEKLFEALVEDINQATTTIFMEFYIIEPRGRVESVLIALEQASKRGVHVFLMLDSVGSNHFLRSLRCKKLMEEGVKTIGVLHANLLRMTLRRQDLRQHRKMIAIDNRIAYTGSMNLADPEYFKTSSGLGPWVDIMVRLEGSIAPVIQGTVIFDWEMETGIRLEKHLIRPEPQQYTAPEANRMQLLPSGPAMSDELLLQALLTAIHTAENSVTITTPYFVPDEALLQALKTSARRGLEVTVILPYKNDSHLAQYLGYIIMLYDSFMLHD
ncbi:MAG: phospholipase D-like domain-containing protein [Reinekea sp.]